MYKIDVYKFSEQRMFNTKDDQFLYAFELVVQKRVERIDINTYTYNRTLKLNARDITFRCHSKDIQLESSPGSLDGRKAHITSTIYMQNKLTRANLYNSTIITVGLRPIPNRLSQPRTGAAATFRLSGGRWDGLKIQVRIRNSSHLGRKLRLWAYIQQSHWLSKKVRRETGYVLHANKVQITCRLTVTR